MMLPFEPIALLSAVPGDVAIGIATPIGLAFAAVWRRLAVVTDRAHNDQVAAVQAMNDMLTAIQVEGITNRADIEAVRKLVEGLASHNAS